jgi:hypothetical protein
LITTAFGLIVAIAAVALNNWFRAIVSGYEEDFQLLKLVFLSYADSSKSEVLNRAIQQRSHAPSPQASQTQQQPYMAPPAGGGIY